MSNTEDLRRIAREEARNAVRDNDWNKYIWQNLTGSTLESRMKSVANDSIDSKLSSFKSEMRGELRDNRRDQEEQIRSTLRNETKMREIICNEVSQLRSDCDKMTQDVRSEVDHKFVNELGRIEPLMQEASKNFTNTYLNTNESNPLFRSVTNKCEKMVAEGISTSLRDINQHTRDIDNLRRENNELRNDVSNLKTSLLIIVPFITIIMGFGFYMLKN